MKKLISTLLVFAALLSLCLALVSCDKDGGSTAGLVTDGDKTYFVAEGGAVLIENGKATPVSAPSTDSEFKSEVFSAPTSLDKAYFTTATKNGGTYITGLTDAGKSASVLIVPNNIAGIAQGAFNGSSLKSLIIATRSSGSLTIDNGAFSGTDGLNVYIACSTEGLFAGEMLADGANNLKLNICAGEYTNFKSHYLFGAEPIGDLLAKF